MSRYNKTRIFDTGGRWEKDPSVLNSVNASANANISRERNRNYNSNHNDQGQPFSVPAPPGADPPVDSDASSSPAPPQAAFGSIAEQMLKKKQQEEALKKEQEALKNMTEEEKLLKILGFSGFGSTKGKHVPSANPFFAKFNKKRKYVQYVNRDGKKHGAGPGSRGAGHSNSNVQKKESF